MTSARLRATTDCKSPSILRDVLSLTGSVLPYSLKFWEWSTNDGQQIWSADQCGDLTGRVAIVTGGTGGVGLETCYELIRHGAHVFLGARSQRKFDKAQREIQQRLASATEPIGKSNEDETITLGKIEYLPCDMTTMTSAQRAADEFVRRNGTGLHMFIACAGRGSGREPINEDGVEPFMATNCVNHVVMLRTLLPLMLRQSSRARIVFVSSVAHHWCSLPGFLGGVPVNFRTWDEVNDHRRSEGALYAQSKLAQILVIKRLTMELQRIQSSRTTTTTTNIRCIALHPGEINNEFVQRHFVDSANRLGMLSFVGKVRPLLRFFLLNAREGARTCLYASTASDIDDKDMQGAYLSYPCQEVMPSRRAYDQQLAQRCWTLINEAIDKRLGASSWLDCT